MVDTLPNSRAEVAVSLVRRSNYDLLSGERMPPLLVATGNADPQKAVTTKNPDHLVAK